jgi:hypothetical protein
MEEKLREEYIKNVKLILESKAKSTLKASKISALTRLYLFLNEIKQEAINGYNASVK